jgi:glycosyltransferase involved in cell wall biosynthesis
MDIKIISVITPTYNSIKFLNDNIESVSKQIVSCLIEHIIIDGDSNDGTKEYIFKLKNTNTVTYKVFSRKDKNMYEAINDGMKIVNGNFWTVLNSDDYFKNEYTLQNYIKEIRDSDVLITPISVVDVNKKKVKDIYLPNFNYKSLVFVEKCLFVNQPGVFLTKKIIDQNFFFDTKYNFASDYDFFIRLFKYGFNKKISKRHYVCFRSHDQSISNSLNSQNMESLLISQNYNENKLFKNLFKFLYLAKYYLYNVRITNFKFIIRKIFQIKQ